MAAWKTQKMSQVIARYELFLGQSRTDQSRLHKYMALVDLQSYDSFLVSAAYEYQKLYVIL